MNEITTGEREPSREFVVASLHVKEIRKITRLTQTKFWAHSSDNCNTFLHYYCYKYLKKV